MKTTLPGVKRWRDVNKRMISKCTLCYSKRSDSNKRMKSCRHKCQHRTPLKVDTLKANKQPQDGLMRHFTLDDTVWGGAFTSSPNGAGRRHQLYPNINEEEVRQKVVFVKYDMSPIETSSTRHGGTTLHIRNLEGPSRSPNHSSYVRMTLLATKVAASWGPGDSSFSRLCQSVVGW